MDNNSVKVKYSDYNNRIADEIEMEMLENIILKMNVITKDGVKGVNLNISDKITETDELSGFMDSDKLIIYIKALKQMLDSLSV